MNPGVLVRLFTRSTSLLILATMLSIGVPTTSVSAAISLPAPGIIDRFVAVASWDVTVDSSGTAYLAGQDFRVRRVDAVTGAITVIAGTGVFGSTGDGGDATAGQIAGLQIEVDHGGNLYILEATRIRKVNLATGIISTIAGTGVSGSTGDGGPAISAQIHNPFSMATDADGNVYFGEVGDAPRVRKITVATGIIDTVAGNGTDGFSGDGGPATAAQLGGNLGGGFKQIDGLAVNASGDLFISDGANKRVRRVDKLTGIISTYAGNGAFLDAGDGGLATAASFIGAGALAFDFAGNLYIADRYAFRVRKVDAATGIITTFAGNGTNAASGDGGPATAASFPGNGTFAQQGLSALATDRLGNLFIADNIESEVRVVGSTLPSPTPPRLIVPVSPLRVFDTRPGEAQGLVSVVKQKYGAANILRVKVTGVAGVPESGVGAVSLNVTVAEPDGAGFVTVFPCGVQPIASSLNYTAGQVVPNAVIAPVSAAGEVCFFSSVNTHLLADINGWFSV